MNFDETAIRTMMDNVTSHAGRLGVFRSVNAHEPRSAPGAGLRYAVWIEGIEPIAEASGLNAVSGYVVITGRIYGNAMQKPEDETDPRIAAAAVTLIGAYSGDFDFGATIKNVDLLGMYGQKLGSRSGFVTIAQTTYRVMDINIPIVVNDMWTIARSG